MLPTPGRPCVSTSHVEGNEGTCGLVLPFPCFLPGCCDGLQTAQPLPFKPREWEQRLLSGVGLEHEFSWLVTPLGEKGGARELGWPWWPEPLGRLGKLLCWPCRASRDRAWSCRASLCPCWKLWLSYPHPSATLGSCLLCLCIRWLPAGWIKSGWTSCMFSVPPGQIWYPLEARASLEITYWQPAKKNHG